MYCTYIAAETRVSDPGRVDPDLDPDLYLEKQKPGPTVKKTRIRS